jgi:hypothetical protein
VDIITALGYLKQLYDWIQGQQEEANRKAAMAKLLATVEDIHALSLAAMDIFKELLGEQTINDQHAKLVQAQENFKESDYSKADQFADDAAVRLMQTDVKVSGALSFLAAAGAHITILTQWAKDHPSQTLSSKLKDRAKLYSDHASSLWPAIADEAAKRITISVVQEGFFPRYAYAIDGKVLSKLPLTEASHAYFEQRNDNDKYVISASAYLPVRTAAETWRALAVSGAPNYAEVFRGIFVKQADSFAWYLVLNGQRLLFQDAACALMFSKIVQEIPDGVFRELEFAGTIPDGATAYHPLNRNPAFVIKGGPCNGKLFAFDSEKPIAANNSQIFPISGADYDSLGVFALTTIDKF